MQIEWNRTCHDLPLVALGSMTTLKLTAFPMFAYVTVSGCGCSQGLFNDQRKTRRDVRDVLFHSCFRIVERRLNA
jgi:hypothetical protein